ncbi:hypothetical protein [Elizabethkingia meningoseptica]|uniref:hypothetical protein n=1 Tax=Elizabethkingia meningoseptica TaxID=238 RepID=UPI0023B18EB5|nr:hypothetical protein [Elizabethkingia meningoseptica]MDE5492430.1 hypothetical protein [Elizabethkingia meningoseptica]
MTKQIIKCFLASPSDTQKEREIAINIISEINRTLGESLNFTIELLKWETNSRPSFQGEYSQQNINNQVGEYHIFVGIMFKKFGTPTVVAGSGTEEEFNIAYERLNSNSKTEEIMFYFNTEQTDLDDINYVELGRVKEFQKKIQDLNGSYWKYKGHVEFERFLREHLSSYLLAKFKSEETKEKATIDLRKLILEEKFKEKLSTALCTFRGQPYIFIEPILGKADKIVVNPDENYERKIETQVLIEDNNSVIIKSPPQFGLTCLSHYLVLEAYKKGKLWIYIDSNKCKSHNIHKAVEKQVQELNYNIENIDCIILDSWVNYEVDSLKKLRNLCEKYKETRIIVMNTVDGSKFLNSSEEINIERNFDILHLLALPRKQVRNVIKQYNHINEIGTEDAVLQKVVSDLDTLNIHRTPLNCITLLKVNEKYFDENPVNRTNLLEKVLFILFNLDEIPKYKSKPDLKDCEYVLGKFSEILIRENKYDFTRDFFMSIINEFCKENLIEIDINLVFDILLNNNVIIQINSTDFCFKAAYWIFYFAAKRMHSSAEFKEFIFESKTYITNPEIIEFYTGIDRNREDALKILTNDINLIRQQVSTKVNLPKEMNPFNFIEWRPQEEDIIKAQEEIKDDILSSGLPEEVKDKYADNGYDQRKPYNQSINQFFEEYSLYNLMQNIRATSRALRNSDYVNPSLKKAALDEILSSWDEICKVLIALTPILAQKGQAEFEGAAFILADDFGDSVEQRVHLIIQHIMLNIVAIFKDDLNSHKMAPLIFKKFENEKNAISKHHIAIFLILTRPKHWKQALEVYITSISKNSFYLFDIVNILKSKYKFDYADETELKEMAYLIKMCYAKHEIGNKKPSIRDISRISNKAIPKRDEDADK